jgi:hypothetical protein
MTDLAELSTFRLSVFEFRRRGIFFGFVSAGQRCACGSSDVLVPMRLVFSNQPLVDAARLLVAGNNRNCRIEMVHGGGNDVALSSTIGAAAALTVKSSATGTPRFVKFYAGDVREPRRCVFEPKARRIRARRKNASARLRLSSARVRGDKIRRRSAA